MFSSAQYVSSTAQENFGLGYSVRLVDQVTSDFVAGMEERADKPVCILLAPDYNHLYRQPLELTIPRETPMNAARWIVLTLRREPEGQQVSVVSDHQLLKDKKIVLDKLAVSADKRAIVTFPTDSY